MPRENEVVNDNEMGLVTLESSDLGTALKILEHGADLLGAEGRLWGPKGFNIRYAIAKAAGEDADSEPPRAVIIEAIMDEIALHLAERMRNPLTGGVRGIDFNNTPETIHDWEVSAFATGRMAQDIMYAAYANGHRESTLRMTEDTLRRKNMEVEQIITQNKRAMAQSLADTATQA